MSPTQAKRIIAALKRSEAKIATERDRLRELESQIEDLDESATRGLEALHEAIDALSELV